jgi:hypothetical protein
MKTLFLICVAISVLAPGSLWASTTAEKKLELNGSSWDVVLMPAGSAEGIVGEDIYTFAGGQFRSKALMSRGFVNTNFMVSLPGGTSDLAVWETMQTGKDGVVFLHGEWVKDKMWGTITEQLEGGRKIVDHTFITRKHWQPEVPKEKSAGEIKTAKIEPSKVDIKPKLMPVLKSRQEPQKAVLSHMSEDEFPAESSTGENKFLEEIEKFEKAQALKIAR